MSVKKERFNIDLIVTAGSGASAGGGHKGDSKSDRGTSKSDTTAKVSPSIDKGKDPVKPGGEKKEEEKRKR